MSLRLGMLTYPEFLKRLPKVDLHCHIAGALRPATLAELATKNGISLPRPAAQLYDFRDFYDFIDILRLSAASVVTVADFSRIAYEALEDGAKLGNLRHTELFFNPHYYYPRGVTYATMLDGLIDGLRAAKADFNVSGLLIPSIDRGLVSSAAAVAMVEEVLADRRDEVVGIGLDGPERAGPAEQFVDAYQLAGRHGLKRTAHVCEDNQTLVEAPPANYLKCRDLLGCDRLDHGYNLLADEDMIRQARADGLFFTGCPVTSVKKNLARRKASLRTMVEAGLRVTLNTDDPTMFHTDIGDSYLSLHESWNYGPDTAQMLSLSGVTASWLGDREKAALRREFEQEIAALRAQLDPNLG